MQSQRNEYGNNVDLRTLRYFLAVVENGSITRAARALQMSQPPLSAAISRLESAVGCRLLRRSRTGVEPTAAGEYLALRAGHHLADIEATLQSLRRMADGNEGHLAIAAEPTISAKVVPDVLARFARASPRVEISLAEGHSIDVMELVIDGRADVGLVPTPDIDRLVRGFGHAVSIYEWRTMKLVIALANEYRDAPDPIDLRELAGEHWLLPRRVSRMPSMQGLLADLWRSLGLGAPEVREVSPLHSALPLVAAGIGVTIVPEIAKSGAPPQIVFREALQELPPLEAVIVVAKDRERTSTVDRFIRLAKEPSGAAETVPADR